MSTRLSIAIACSVLTAAIPVAMAQNAEPATKPSPYVGVSQPPPDDSIVSTPDAAANPTPAVRATSPAAERPFPAERAPALVKRPVDPDAGIVTRPVLGNAYEAARGNAEGTTDRSGSGTLYRPANPDADIVTYVKARPGELPEGTNIPIKLAQQLSSTDTRMGNPFSGKVSRDVMLEGRVVIPQGSELRGRVTSVTEGHRFRNRATIRLRPDAIILPDGSQYAVHAAMIGAHSRNTKVDSEGGATTKSQVKKDTIEEGIGAGSGAIAGAAFGGPPGAAVGTLVGVGVVTTHLIVQRPQAVDLPTNTTIVFSLTEPLALTPLQN